MRIPECEVALESWLSTNENGALAKFNFSLASTKGTPPASADQQSNDRSLNTSDRIVLKCVESSDGGRGYYTAPPSVIHINVKGVSTPTDVSDVLRHELLHASDHLFHKLDLTSCGGLACSEVRAAAAVECAGLTVASQRRACIRDKAATSAELVFRGLGRACVNAVFDACVATTPEENPAVEGSPFSTLINAEIAALASADASMR